MTPMHRVWAKKDRFIITYWCRDQQFLNIAAIVVRPSLLGSFDSSPLIGVFSKPASSASVATQGWDGVGVPSEFRAAFANCVESLPRLLSYVTSAGLWGMCGLEPLETWVNGRAIVIGDAAHPMLPST